jgi:hypothetical protein
VAGDEVTNDIKIGDWVQIGGTFITGKVVDVDDHPFEYAMIEIEIVGACGAWRQWHSVRLAKKIKPIMDSGVPMVGLDTLLRNR